MELQDRLRKHAASLESDGVPASEIAILYEAASEIDRQAEVVQLRARVEELEQAQPRCFPEAGICGRELNQRVDEESLLNQAKTKITDLEAKLDERDLALRRIRGVCKRSGISWPDAKTIIGDHLAKIDAERGEG